MCEHDQLDEAALVSSDRFERLFRGHYAAVVAYVRRRAPADAVDDVVAETFLDAWRRLRRVPAEELPWLLGVARNVLATQQRSGLRRARLGLRLTRGGGEPEAEPAGDRFDGRLSGALARLAAKDREALLLIAWDGLSPAEAANALGEEPGTFRVRLHRARGRLRRLLEEDSGPAQPASEHELRVTEDCS
jgi:RNA polymerase sigma-70 factor, ECF subfamily